MTEYIEREALVHNLKRFAPEQLTPLIESLIQKQPAADVVEVVRCCKCKYGILLEDDAGEYVKCGDYDLPVDGFCAKGKRNEGDDK